MVYKFDKRVVNYSKVDHFYDKNNFVGYILPNGEIYPCKNHNVSNVKTVLEMSIELLKRNFNDKKSIIDNSSHDKLLNIVINYLNKATYDEILALSKFMDKNLYISDIIVQLFGCHLITRLNKTIITSEINHDCFFDYLLNDYKIFTIDKIIYDKDKKEYRFVSGKDRNDYLHDEVNEIKKSVKNEELDLFYKGR